MSNWPKVKKRTGDAPFVWRSTADELRVRVDALEAELAAHVWVPVIQWVPEEDEDSGFSVDMWVYSKTFGQTKACCRMPRSGIEILKWYDGMGKEITKVTHVMPLPAPPEDNDGNV